MKANYFEALTLINKRQFPLYIITGKESFQMQELAHKITDLYHQQKFEILREQISNQQYGFIQQQHNALSLFSTHRLLQITFPKAPDKQGQKILTESLQNISEDDRYLLIFEDLTSAQQKSKWFQTIAKEALYIPVWPLNTQDAIKVIQLQIKKNNLKLTQDAILLLVQKTEGNLFAASQILQSLTQHTQKSYDTSTLSEYLSNHMNYDVFDLIQSLAEQKLSRSLSILQHLQSIPIEPAIILWGVLNEIRLWAKLSQQNTQEQQKTFMRNNIWRARQPQYQRLVNKISHQQYSELLNLCFRIDLLIKGVASGNTHQQLIHLVSLTNLTVLNAQQNR